MKVATLVLAAWLSASQSAVFAQGTAAAPARLSVGGDVATPLSLTTDELKKLPRATVEIKAEDGTLHRYDGVRVEALLKMAGVTLGQMRSDSMTSYLLATATDGYRVVFAVAELDSAFTANDVIVADTLDGRPLPDGQGPLRLVAPKDLRPTRWVRTLQRLDVSRVKP